MNAVLNMYSMKALTATTIMQFGDTSRANFYSVDDALVMAPELQFYDSSTVTWTGLWTVQARDKLTLQSGARLLGDGGG